MLSTLVEEAINTVVNEGVGVEEKPTFAIIKGGTTRGKDMLMELPGFVYTVRKETNTTRFWWCNNRGKGERCPASVSERRGAFKRGAHNHSHPPDPGCLLSKLSMVTEQNMRGPRPMQRPHGPHGHPGPARPPVPGPGQARLQGPGGLAGPGMRPPPGQGPIGIGGPMRHSVQQGPPGLVPRGPSPVPPRPVIQASNITNDPRGAHCRIFVGNLNTIAMKKEDVENIFRRYGLVTGISMHKGYAFVQYQSHEVAKRASMAEDGKTYAGQTLDINIASEPKKGTTKRAGGLDNSQSGNGPSMEKKLKMDGGVHNSKTLTELGFSAQASSTSITLSRPTGKALKKTTITTGNDFLICGNCRSLYHSLATFVQHKKQKCELKTVCKCQDKPDNNLRDDRSREPERTLLCAVCDAVFLTAWDLCQHCQEEHSIAIFKEFKSEVNGDK